MYREVKVIQTKPAQKIGLIDSDIEDANDLLVRGGFLRQVCYLISLIIAV